MRRARGFTLIEVMIAVAILATITTLLWSSFRGTLKTKAAIETQSERYRSVRLGLERMAREISMAYLSQNEDTSQQERRTFFIGRRSGDIDELRFSYFGHQRLYQDANECDTAQVGYYGGRDPNESRVRHLLRRETRRLNNIRMEDAPSEVDILCDNVTMLRIDYYDVRDKKWRDSWSTIAADGQPDRLPTRVRLSMTVKDERNQDVIFQTETRIAMQEPLNLKAVDVAAPPPLQLPGQQQQSTKKAKDAPCQAGNATECQNGACLPTGKCP